MAGDYTLMVLSGSFEPPISGWMTRQFMLSHSSGKKEVKMRCVMSEFEINYKSTFSSGLFWWKSVFSSASWVKRANLYKYIYIKWLLQNSVHSQHVMCWGSNLNVHSQERQPSAKQKLVFRTCWGPNGFSNLVVFLHRVFLSTRKSNFLCMKTKPRLTPLVQTLASSPACW